MGGGWEGEGRGGGGHTGVLAPGASRLWAVAAGTHSHAPSRTVTVIRVRVREGGGRGRGEGGAYRCAGARSLPPVGSSGGYTLSRPQPYSNSHYSQAESDCHDLSTKHTNVTKTNVGPP